MSETLVKPTGPIITPTVNVEIPSITVSSSPMHSEDHNHTEKNHRDNIDSGDSGSKDGSNENIDSTFLLWLNSLPPIHQAAAKGEKEAIAKLLGASGSKISSTNDLVNSKSTDGSTPLLVASSVGNARIVRFLLSVGASPTARDNQGQTALHLASINNHRKSAEHLLSHRITKAILNRRDKAGFTCLHHAVVQGHKKMAKILIDHGIKVAKPTKQGLGVLHLAISHLAGRGALLLDMLKMLLVAAQNQAQGVPVFVKHVPGTGRPSSTTLSPLTTSPTKITNAMNGSTGLSLSTSTLPTPSNGTSSTGASSSSPITASHSSSINPLSLTTTITPLPNPLVTMIDPNDGGTALHIASHLGETACVNLLIQYKADVSAADYRGLTPLHLAILAGHDDVCHVLCSSGADVSLRYTVRPLKKTQRIVGGGSEMSSISMASVRTAGTTGSRMKNGFLDSGQDMDDSTSLATSIHEEEALASVERDLAVIAKADRFGHIVENQADPKESPFAEDRKSLKQELERSVKWSKMIKKMG
eukprot:TRINITY_DN3582_c0_g4_i1.p1 TRINITY_DN3582_c0_g4~~TRINITY_DN3582_c0_g4_i1.p1  ORF type:complete len:530 (-),score=111.01 TRINITY_DN3582_c0_g4_i1:977-2566(-)